jgi:hypothetical protein
MTHSKVTEPDAGLLGLFDELPFPSGKQILFLRERGIRIEAMAEPWPIRATECSLVFRADDCGEPVDLIAWLPELDIFVPWIGTGFCVGDADDCLTASELRIHATPLDWLRAGRDGIVIVRRELCHTYLRNCRRLLFTDPYHKERVRLWCRPKRPPTKFIVEGIAA